MAASSKSSDTAQTDRHFMGIALNMARRGLGTTAPNPSVGAVIVRSDGVIPGRGWTKPGGRPHAEVEALARAGDAARGATLYVTLEPCSHHGKSPPCADAVVNAGIRRVVCGVGDPDTRVAGQGFAKLRDAGIEVLENVMASEAHWLTLGHILKTANNRPFVQMKIATGRDGLIAPGDGEPVWVTGPLSRRCGHLMRARADAILVGIGTVLADDPSLDCRLRGLEKHSPKIIVLDRHNRLPKNAKTASSGRMLSLASSADLAALLAQLVNKGITRLLVEGGPRVWRSFLDAGLVDEIVHFKGPANVGAGGLQPFVEDGLERFVENEKFVEVDQRAMGDDKMFVYRNINSMKAD